jgi:hypothetical protein
MANYFAHIAVKSDADPLQEEEGAFLNEASIRFSIREGSKVTPKDFAQNFIKKIGGTERMKVSQIDVEI